MSGKNFVVKGFKKLRKFRQKFQVAVHKDFKIFYLIQGKYVNEIVTENTLLFANLTIRYITNVLGSKHKCYDYSDVSGLRSKGYNPVQKY